jgi:hypothetical protein
MKKVRCTESRLDEKPVRKRCVLTEEKLYEIRARIEHTTKVTETPCTGDRRLENFSSHCYGASSTSAVQGDVHALQPSDTANRQLIFAVSLWW